MTEFRDYPEVAKLKEKGLRNSSDVDIHFKDTVAIATSCAWAPSEDPEEDGGSDTNRTDTTRTDERYVQDVGVRGKENEGVEDLVTYPSPSSDRPKRKRVGKGDKGGSVGHRMCEQSDRIIESVNNENNVTGGNITNAPPSLADCLDILKQLPGLTYGGGR
ncbi:hypothetical protein OROGR_006481 [Orobanche gracilis]